MHDAGRRSRVPASSDGPSSSTCATILATHKPAQAPQSHHTVTTAAAPVRGTFFDPWNSSSTGHQRAENRLSGSTSWRASRNRKLGEQYREGLGGGGGRRIAGALGGGNMDSAEGGRKENGVYETGVSSGQKSLVEIWAASKAGTKMCQDKKKKEKPLTPSDMTQERGLDVPQEQLEAPAQLPEKPIFAGLCFYINGSTAPLVSDHKLKHVLALHGARHSIALGRRTVTHVIIGTSSTHGGAGGGLASTKLQKEIARTGGKAVKFITAEWVLQSIKAGQRLPESRFAPIKLSAKSQSSVLGMLGSKQDQG